MRQTLRPYATIGVAIMGAGLIIATPVAGPLPGLPDVQSPAVRLTDAWTDAFNTASANATTLMNNFYLAPGVGLQQFFANQAGFWQGLLNDPAGSSNDVAQQMQANLAAVSTGYALQGADADTAATVESHTLDGVPGLLGGSAHAFLFSDIPSFLPPGTDPATVTPVIDFLASPASGIIMGELGPGISPWVALLNSMTDHDSFSDTLANMFSAYFNGATLNLDSLVPTINGLDLFPPGMYMQHLDVAFGGLLTPGEVGVGPYQVLGEGGHVAASIPAVGGSIFNSIGLDFNGVPALGTLDIASQAVGPIGAWEAWGQTIGALLGSGWDGTGTAGTGPVDVTAPLVGVDLPTLPDDGGAAASVAADVPSWLQDLIAAL